MKRKETTEGREIKEMREEETKRDYVDGTKRRWEARKETE